MIGGKNCGLRCHKTSARGSEEERFVKSVEMWTDGRRRAMAMSPTWQKSPSPSRRRTSSTKILSRSPSLFIISLLCIRKVTRGRARGEWDVLLLEHNSDGDSAVVPAPRLASQCSAQDQGADGGEELDVGRRDSVSRSSLLLRKGIPEKRELLISKSLFVICLCPAPLLIVKP